MNPFVCKLSYKTECYHWCRLNRIVLGDLSTTVFLYSLDVLGLYKLREWSDKKVRRVKSRMFQGVSSRISMVG